jgi:hypothetical protein
MLLNGNTFKCLDEKLASARKKIELDYTTTSVQIQEKITLDHVTQQINLRRNKFLQDIELNQLILIKALNEKKSGVSLGSISREKLNFLANKTEEDITIKFQLALNRIEYKADFELFQKLNYSELYKHVDTISLPAHCEHIINLYKLSLNKYFVYDHKSREIKLLDKKFNTIKSIPVRVNYHCIQYEIARSRIVCNFSNPLKSRTHVSVFDYDLNIIRSRHISAREITMIHIGQNHVYYTCTATNKYIVFDLDLNDNDTISFELIGFVFSVADDKILKYYLNKELTILSRKNLSLVRSIPVGGRCIEDEPKHQDTTFKVCNIFFDSKSNFFVVSRSTTGNSFYSFEYYDLNGNLLRKRPLLRETFEHTFFKVFDEKIYYFDERKLISIY